MLFIGAALLISVALALVISNDAGSLVGLNQAETAQIVPLLIILILVAGGAFSRRRRFSHLLAGIFLWFGVFGVSIIGYTYRLEFTTFAQRIAGEFSPGSALVSEDGTSAVFNRSLGGSFRVNVLINGTAVSMIFDTGASAVVLSHDDAATVGIDTDALRYNIQVNTANGVGQAAAIYLNDVQTGEIVRNDIRAFVAERGALETSLLGMTFLETLSGYSVSRDALEFRD